MEILIVLFLAIIIIAGLATYNALTWGLVTYCFYYWFILPVFITLPEITFLQSIGFVFFISLFQNQNTSNGDENDKMLLKIIISPWIILLLGLTFKQFLL